MISEFGNSKLFIKIMSDYFPIERPDKSFSSSSRGVGMNYSASNKKGDKKEKKGWSFGVSAKSEEDSALKNRYMRNLSDVKDGASGINKNKYRNSVVKPWTFNSVRSDSNAPELNNYRDSLSKLKGNINKNKN